MEVLEIRPARVSAKLVAIGDMLVSSPIGADGPRPSRWIGAVTEHIIVEQDSEGQPIKPSEWRQWRVGRVDGVSVETTPIPADGWVWVHLPVVDGPERLSGLLAGKALPAGTWGDPIPSEAGPERDAWLAARGWESYEEWAGRGDEA